MNMANGGIDAKIETFETIITAVVQPIVPILNQNGAHASSPVVDAQFTTDTIANVETHL